MPVLRGIGIVVALAAVQCSSDEHSQDMGQSHDLADLDQTDQPPDIAVCSDLWCATQWPYQTFTAVDQETEPLYVQVRVDGITPTTSGDPALLVELGMGPVLEQPDSPSWLWVPGEYNPDCTSCEQNDEYLGTFVPEAVGPFLWAARVRYGDCDTLYCDRADEDRLGSSDGWAAWDAPRIIVRGTDSVTVVTLNLRCLIDDWDSRLPIIADTLGDLDPDLIGLQEVCQEMGGRDNLTELADALGDRTGREYHLERTTTHRAWDRYNEGLALVSPHAISDVHIGNLPAGVFPRKLLSARIGTPLGTVLFSTTHLDQSSDAVRADQIASALQTLEGRTQPGQATILTGDFNEGPGGSVETTLTDAGFLDLWSSLRPGEDGPTMPSNQPTSRIDWIWLHPKDSGAVSLTIERILEVPVEGTYGSDHLGLSAVVSR